MQCQSSDERGAFGGCRPPGIYLSRSGECGDTRVCPGREEVRARWLLVQAIVRIRNPGPDPIGLPVRSTPMSTTTKLQAQALRHFGRRLADLWNASVTMSAQDRADAYVARMPVSVIAR